MDFKDFLEDVTLLEGGENSGRPGYNDRPKKSLWFKNPTLWLSDMSRHSGNPDMEVINTAGDTIAVGGEEEEFSNDDLYVVDKDRQQCYGAWRKEYKQGITFTKPRPLSTVKRKKGY